MKGDARVLVAGIGNVFFGDDGFGVEVALRLRARPPPRALVLDIGIRGIDLTYALLDGWDATILVDAMRRGDAAGTLYVVEPELQGTEPGERILDAHGIDPEAALRAATASGARLGPVRIVGCEPHCLGDDPEHALRLSPPVARAVDPAVELVRSLVTTLCPESHHA